MLTTSNRKQRCKICGVRLSLYNDDILCFSCQEKEEEQTFINESHGLFSKKLYHKSPKHTSALNSREFVGFLGGKIKISISSREQ